MSTHSWEMVAPGRYATEYQGHVLQAIRKDGPYERDARPYLAVVDKMPLPPGEWSLNRAKTRAIQHVERQNGRAKAERIFRPKSSILIPEPAPDECLPADAVLTEHMRAIDGVLELPPADAPEPVSAPPVSAPPVSAPPDATETVSQGASSALLFVTLTDPDLFSALNALRETLSLLREFAEVKCTVSLPPTLEL
jgi:hypothetical protein